MIQMSLHEEMRLFTELSGEDGAHTSIARIGGYIDGYERGKADSKWIPCYERLPEEGTEVLGTDNHGCIRHVYKDKTGLYEFATVEEGMHLGIVAWQPLPEPWKGDRE